MVQNLSEYRAIAATVQHYIDGAKAGRSDLMKPAFHDIATLTGYVDGGLNNGAIQILFDWVDQNGAATTLEAEIVSIDITGTAATVKLQADNWYDYNFTDYFSLVKLDGTWKILSKVFYTY